MSAQQDQALARETGGDAEAEIPATHSGRLLVRMPGTLHAELAREADREGVSLNAFIVAALSGAVAWRSDPAARAAGAAAPGAPTGGPSAAGAAAPGAPTGGPSAAGAVTAGAAAPVTAVPAQPVVLAPAAAHPSRSLSLALAVNLVVVVLAAAAAVGLLIAAWPG
jgi:HicB family